MNKRTVKNEKNSFMILDMKSGCENQFFTIAYQINSSGFFKHYYYYYFCVMIGKTLILMK